MEGYAGKQFVGIDLHRRRATSRSVCSATVGVGADGPFDGQEGHRRVLGDHVQPTRPGSSRPLNC